MILHPGDFYFTPQSVLIQTLLGSCIAMVMWHPKYHLGGMCHFVLPDRQVPLNTEKIGHYAGGAMQLFLAHTQARGTFITDYVAKIFGGANSVTELLNEKEKSIGARNAQIAMQLLQEQNVKISVADIGQSGYRRLIFNLSNGDVWVKQHSNNLHINEQPTIVEGITR